MIKISQIFCIFWINAQGQSSCKISYWHFRKFQIFSKQNSISKLALLLDLQKKLPNQKTNLHKSTRKIKFRIENLNLKTIEVIFEQNFIWFSWKLNQISDFFLYAKKLFTYVYLIMAQITRFSNFLKTWYPNLSKFVKIFIERVRVNRVD